jgi:hypothetical protein
MRTDRPSAGGEPAVGRHLYGALLVRSRRIQHFMPTTGGPVPQEPHKTSDRRHPGYNHRRPHQYLSQPQAPLDLDDPPLRVTKSGQAVHALPDAHVRLDANARHRQQYQRNSVIPPVRRKVGAECVRLTVVRPREVRFETD